MCVWLKGKIVNLTGIKCRGFKHVSSTQQRWISFYSWCWKHRRITFETLRNQRAARFLRLRFYILGGETHHAAWHHLTARPPGWWRTCHPSQDLPALLIATGHLNYSLLVIHTRRPLIPFKYVSLHARLRLLSPQLSLHFCKLCLQPT